ncbi:MAG: ABC transporter substrate-binding protein [Alphaproteobacteria bacterium]|nr:ABC transporter substrate-binding protein [Alphaproteobacteria bacterium]
MSDFQIPNGPERIVCLTEEPTEILYTLGESDRIVGISAYTKRPPEAKQDKPVVSAFVGGSVKKIKALEPDLIIGFSDVQAELAGKLIKAGLPVLIFNQRTIQEIFEVIVSIGNLVGQKTAARYLVASYIERIATIRARAAKLPRRPKVYFEEWHEPMISAIRWVSELITIAGGDDIFSHLSSGRASKERFVSTHDVATAQPDIYLASWCGKPFDRQEALKRFEGHSFPALEKDMIVEVPSHIILQPGPASLTAGLDFLEATIQRWAKTI